MQQIATLGYAMKKLDLPVDLVPEHEQIMPVYVNPRLLRALGRYVWRRGERYIELSPLTFETPKLYREVLPHEAAHVMAGFKAGHGIVWRAWCSRLGGVPRATIPCDFTPELQAHVEARQVKRNQRIVACCVRCGFKLIKSSALRSDRIYTHRHCGGRFIKAGD